MEVSDIYAHAAYSFGSCTFKVAYSINVEQAYAMLIWFRLVTPETQCEGENLNNCYYHRSLQLYFSPIEYWYTITTIIMLLLEALCHFLQTFFLSWDHFWRCTVSLGHAPVLLCYGGTAPKYLQSLENCANNVHKLKKDMIHAFF